jgi:signal transduction histidine kinase
VEVPVCGQCLFPGKLGKVSRAPKWPRLTLDGLRRVCEKLLMSGARQEQLIDALLTLASSEGGLGEQEPFDLAAITRQVLTQGALDRARRRGLQVRTNIAPAPTVGDPHLTQRLVSNLIENANRHNHDNGQILVTTGTRAGLPFLSVVNSGPVIPESEIGRLLEPFQQLGRPRTGHRNGHGLGLAIVAAIAAAHHASLSLRPHPEGGLTVEVAFNRPSPRPGDHDRSTNSRHDPPVTTGVLLAARTTTGLRTSPPMERGRRGGRQG